MTIPTGERSLHKVQLLNESVEGTPVAATILFPAESSTIIELDRAPVTPEEDWGEFAQSRPSRSSFGVRQATMPMRSDLRFEDVIRILDSALSGGVSPTGSNPYVWTYDLDNTTDTLVSKTIEEGDNQVVYQMAGALIQRIRFSFDALNPGSASPWKLEITWLGRTKTKISAFASGSAPAAMETAMGHLCRLYYGAATTAFAELDEITGSILSADITVETGVVLRKQGGQGDLADSHGRMRTKVTFTVVVEQTSAAYTAFWSKFQSDTLDPTITSHRMRLGSAGRDLDTDERQSVTLTGSPTGGDFTLTYSGQTTGAIAFDATAATVQAALWALSNIGNGDVRVTGAAGGPWTVQFTNALGAQNVATMTASGAGLTGGTTPGVSIAVVNEGVATTPKSIIFDMQVEVDQMPINEANGSTRYSLQGRAVRDATLASSLRVAVTNAIAS